MFLLISFAENHKDSFEGFRANMIEELLDAGQTVYVGPSLSVVVSDPLKEREA